MPEAAHRNHLIIGLGGTGGVIIRSLRKIVYQTFRGDIPPTVNLRYLFVDSSTELMSPDDPSWKILGHSVQLPERSQLHISGMNLKDVVTNLGAYPGLKPWLGNREDWNDILSSADAANIIGGQKRRLGRFLFATSAGKFRQRVSELVHEMQEEKSRDFPPNNATTFHVCCGLAGGTGSGSIVDVVSQIRAAYPDSQYRIIIYALLPERSPAAYKAGPNYHANGYAALVELNALSIGSWAPHDVLGRDGARLKVQDVFNCCYLFNDENEANVSVSVATELPDIVASFLFQKIVQIHNIEWGSNANTLLRQETYEVGAQAKEAEKSPNNKSPRRTRSFLSFGIKQIAYPEVEIREYLTYSFAQQATRQLLFNKWIEGEGYKDEAVNQNFHEFVAEPATLTQWYLTDERLTLSEGILPAEVSNKNWKPIGDFWKILLPNYVTHVIDQYKDAVVKMLPELTKLCETAYNEQYRGSGVTAFYETKRKEMKDHVLEIRSRIERDLFASWKNGERSMHDVDRLVSALIESLENRLGAIDGRIAKLGEDSEAYKENEKKIAENRKQWAKLGPLSIAIGKHKNILQAQAEASIVRYTMKARLEGFRYARELVVGLIQELKGLAATITGCKKLVTDAATDFQRAMESRLQDRGNRDISKQVVRHYDPEQIRNFTKMLTGDRTEQKKQTAQVRDKLTLLLGDRQTFPSFLNRITPGTFRETLEQSCSTSADAAHSDMTSVNPDHGKLLGVSLIELLRREYDANEQQMKTYTKSVMDMAKNYLKLDRGQQQLVGPGIPAYNDEKNAICVTNITIIAPEAPEAVAFRKKFCEALSNATTTGERAIVTNRTRPEEITIISITSVFPARFVSVAAFLKQEYETRLKAGGNRAFLELHSEGAGFRLAMDQQMYDLFAETCTPADIRPWVRLAMCLGAIKEGKDQTGRSIVQLVKENRYGLPETVDLGTSVDSAIDNADPASKEEMEAQVNKLLQGPFLHLDKRRELAAATLEKVKVIGASAGIDAPEYKREVAAYNTIRKILEIED
jgi:hypothetical protein